MIWARQIFLAFCYVDRLVHETIATGFLVPDWIVDSQFICSS